MTGKSTLLSGLSGRLMPAVGARIEGDGLALGVFTQDLAQDLDQEASAVDVVTRKVCLTHPLITHPLITHPLITHPLMTHCLMTHPLITHPLKTQLITHPLTGTGN